ncbi:tryptophan-rich sensory protein [Paenibacillus sp. CC-CFT747]|nr:tryptophan-rich sensory protein [Paenibacillus sp. CC-CFT747]
MSKPAWRWANLIILVVVLVMNTLANVLPLNGQTTGEISDRYPVLLTPSSYVFSIWTLIYALLIGFVLLPFRGTPAGRAAVERIGPWFFVNGLLNSLWIVLWHYDFIYLSLVAMAGILLSLIVIYNRIHSGERPHSTGELWFVRIAFSVYLGWICVATIVNVGVVLLKAGWDGWGLSPETWTVIMLVVAAGLAVAVSYRTNDIFLTAVFIWAFVGIGVKQQDLAIVRTPAYGLALLLLVYLLWTAKEWKEHRESYY